jgi:hypothetical protein
MISRAKTAITMLMVRPTAAAPLLPKGFGVIPALVIEGCLSAVEGANDPDPQPPARPAQDEHAEHGHSNRRDQTEGEGRAENGGHEVANKADEGDDQDDKTESAAQSSPDFPVHSNSLGTARQITRICLQAQPKVDPSSRA